MGVGPEEAKQSVLLEISASSLPKWTMGRIGTICRKDFWDRWVEKCSVLSYDLPIVSKGNHEPIAV